MQKQRLSVKVVGADVHNRVWMFGNGQRPDSRG